MTVNEAADRLGKSPKAVYRHIERGTELGELFIIKHGRRFCYARELASYIGRMEN